MKARIQLISQAPRFLLDRNFLSQNKSSIEHEYCLITVDLIGNEIILTNHMIIYCRTDFFASK